MHQTVGHLCPSKSHKHRKRLLLREFEMSKHILSPLWSIASPDPICSAAFVHVATHNDRVSQDVHFRGCIREGPKCVTTILLPNNCTRTTTPNPKYPVIVYIPRCAKSSAYRRLASRLLESQKPYSKPSRDPKPQTPSAPNQILKILGLTPVPSKSLKHRKPNSVQPSAKMLKSPTPYPFHPKESSSGSYIA